MTYNFDFFDRAGLNTLKWEYELQRSNDSDLLCFGTADMDFTCPPPVLKAIAEITRHGHLGYPAIRPAYYGAIEGWLERTTGWQVDACATTGTNVGIYTAAARAT